MKVTLSVVRPQMSVQANNVAVQMSVSAPPVVRMNVAKAAVVSIPASVVQRISTLEEQTNSISWAMGAW